MASQSRQGERDKKRERERGREKEKEIRPSTTRPVGREQTAHYGPRYGVYRIG